MGSRLTPSPADTAEALGLDVNGIMWTDRTLNPGLAGCGKVSPACTNCYAEITAAGIVRKGRSPKSAPGMRATAEFYAEGLTPDGRWTGRVSVHPERIGPAFADLPKKASAKTRRVFFSMIDLFHEDVPFDFIDAVFVEMAARPQVFQVLTKRAERMAAYARQRALPWPANVWAGVTVEDQRRADERIPHLLQVPAAVRFLSVEPMLGRIDLDKLWCHNCDTDEHVSFEPPAQPWCIECDSEVGPAGWLDSLADRRQAGINWVIVGSESDGPRPGARETREEWITGIVDQCDAAGVPVFCKQAAIGGRLCALPLVDGKVRAEFPEVTHV